MASPHLFDSCPRFALLWMVAKSSITLVFQPIPFMGCLPSTGGFRNKNPWVFHGFSMVVHGFSWFFIIKRIHLSAQTRTSSISSGRTMSLVWRSSSGGPGSVLAVAAPWVAGPWHGFFGGILMHLIIIRIITTITITIIIIRIMIMIIMIIMTIMIIMIRIITMIIMIYLICLWDFMRCSDVFCCEFLSYGILWV